jgi:hypothetical protein
MLTFASNLFDTTDFQSNSESSSLLTRESCIKANESELNKSLWGITDLRQNLIKSRNRRQEDYRVNYGAIDVG